MAGNGIFSYETYVHALAGSTVRNKFIIGNLKVYTIFSILGQRICYVGFLSSRYSKVP